MGEKSRREKADAVARKIQKNLIDSKKVIDGGFASFMLTVFGYGFRDKLPPEQIKAMRDAWFGGSAHLFMLMTSSMSEGDEIQQQDMDLMAAIQEEIDIYARLYQHDPKDVNLRSGDINPQGNA